MPGFCWAEFEKVFRIHHKLHWIFRFGDPTHRTVGGVATARREYASICVASWKTRLTPVFPIFGVT